MKSRNWLSPLVLVLLTVSGCNPTQPPPTGGSSQSTSTSESPPKATVTPKELAVAARDALQKKLGVRLLEAMGTGGPPAAIEVCSREASRIADRVGNECGVKIGRTSFKLRNLRNTPPEWAVPLIEQRPTEPQFVELADRHTGALFPILLKVQCLACHGPKDQIAEDVREQLAKLYPDDHAIGFNDGDLRGWFWVEVPDQGGTGTSNGVNGSRGGAATREGK